MALTVALEMTGAGVRPARMYADRDVKIVIGRVTFDSGYVSGGETLTPSADLNLNELYTIVFTPAISGTLVADSVEKYNVMNFTYDYTNNKVIAFCGSGVDAGQLGFTEATTLDDLSSFTTRFVAFGI